LVKQPAANVSTRLRIEQPDRGRDRSARVLRGSLWWLRREQLRLDHSARYRLGPFQLTGDSCHAGEHNEEAQS
jgi:hypothetical protein